MSLEVDGVWKGGLWASTVWNGGVWRVGEAITTYGNDDLLLVDATFSYSLTDNSTGYLLTDNSIDYKSKLEGDV